MKRDQKKKKPTSDIDDKIFDVFIIIIKTINDTLFKRYFNTNQTAVSRCIGERGPFEYDYRKALLKGLMNFFFLGD